MKPVTEAWLIKAGEDLDAIRSLRGNPQLTGVVAFHAQQFADHVHATVLAMLS